MKACPLKLILLAFLAGSSTPRTYAAFGGKLGDVASNAMASVRVRLPAYSLSPYSVAATDISWASSPEPFREIRFPELSRPKGTICRALPLQIPFYFPISGPFPLLVVSQPPRAELPSTGVIIPASPPFMGPKAILPTRFASQSLPGKATRNISFAPTRKIPLPADFSTLASARLVRDGLLAGELNPRNPEWRPQLALLLSKSGGNVGSDELFALLLAGCAGHDEQARIATAQAWAAEREEGRFAPVIALFAARRAFEAGDYATAINRCETAAKSYPKESDRVMLLLALALAQTGEKDRAMSTLRALRETHPNSPTAPEARFMEAWLALQDARANEAAVILAEVVAANPRSQTAAKASRMLAAIKGTP